MANKLIQLKDHLGNLLFPKIKRDVISATNSIEQTITTNASWVSTKINIDKATIVGNKLTLDTVNKRVIIGAGVSKILLSAQVYAGNNITTMFGAKVKKNGAIYASSFNHSGGSWGATATMVPIPVDVKENDYFELFCYFDQPQSSKTIDAGNRSYMTIEVLE